MAGIVYIAHCIDTEGPLYQSEKVPFQMLKNTFNIDIEPTKENLRKLQNMELDLNGKEAAAANLLAAHKIKTCGSWNEIDSMLAIITKEEYRKILPDSKGNGWKYSWFCMDHVGFTGENPRKRDAGFHNIFDHYYFMEGKDDDTVQFHHHPVPISGNYNESGTAYWGKGILNEILARRVIDRQWFPSAYRPGFHTERPDSNWFLEQWIPFDYANQSVKGLETDQPDLSGGRFGDWRRATTEWKIYHPDHDDYQTEGNCRRWIARCLNMNARLREITKQDIREAFIRAKHKENTLLSFTDHDYKNMIYDIEKVRDMIKEVSMEFKEVPFEYVNAVEGMQKTLDIRKNYIDLEMDLAADENGKAILYIKSNSSIFGPQPFLAIKTLGRKYYWDNFDFESEYKWSYTFDNHTLNILEVEAIGVAANSVSGVGEVLVYDLKSGKIMKNVVD